MATKWYYGTMKLKRTVTIGNEEIDYTAHVEYEVGYIPANPQEPYEPEEVWLEQCVASIPNALFDRVASLGINEADFYREARKLTDDEKQQVISYALGV